MYIGIGLAREYGEQGEGLLEKVIEDCWFGVL